MRLHQNLTRYRYTFYPLPPALPPARPPPLSHARSLSHDRRKMTATPLPGCSLQPDMPRRFFFSWTWLCASSQSPLINEHLGFVIGFKRHPSKRHRGRKEVLPGKMQGKQQREGGGQKRMLIERARGDPSCPRTVQYVTAK